MNMSIIIPTYGRREGLRRTLGSLQEQTLPDFEILVVDNAADAEVERMVREFNRSARVPVHYVPEPRLGLHNTRHTGAREGKGEILVYADDDQTFGPGVVAAYAKAFAEHPEMSAAGGPIRLVWESPPPSWLLEYIGQARIFPILGLLDAYDEFRLDPKGFFFGGNMAIRRDVLFKVGGFNPGLVGDRYLGDSEVGLYRKLWQRQMLIGYIPEAVMYNYVPPERMTVSFFCRRMANEGISDIYSHYHPGVPHELSLLKHAVAIVVRNRKCWMASLLRRGRTDRGSVDIQIDAARTRSQLKFLVRLVLNKELRKLVQKKDWLEGSCESVSSPV